MDSEEIKDRFEAKYGNLKGVLGVCASFDWAPGKISRPHLKIYVLNTKTIDGMPQEFMDLPCEYFVGNRFKGCD